MSLFRAMAVVLLGFGPATAFAQSGELALPAEFPPASFTGNQYVDSTGCAFLRAGLSGVVTWVPRVNRDRTQLCGFQPTLVSPTATIAANAAAIAGAPVIAIPDAIAPAASDVADVELPTATVAAPPLRVPVVPPARIRPVSPRIIAMPAAVVPPPVTAPIPHMTMAEICADVAATGHRYLNAETGVAVRCGPQTQPSIQSGVTVVAATAPAMVKLDGQVISLAQLCRISDATGNRYLIAATGVSVRCGAQTQSPSGLTAALDQDRRVQTEGASPAAIAPAEPVSPPPGFEAVWDDGRLNPNRGLPAAQGAAGASAMNVTQPVATGHRFVQVGTFADPANATRTAAWLQSVGLPVGFANFSRNGTAMRVVAAGPFADTAALQAALQTARAAGFSDAFTRS